MNNFIKSFIETLLISGNGDEKTLFQRRFNINLEEKPIFFIWKTGPVGFPHEFYAGRLYGELKIFSTVKESMSYIADTVITGNVSDPIFLSNILDLEPTYKFIGEEHGE